jgi:hypothetical protein
MTSGSRGSSLTVFSTSSVKSASAPDKFGAASYDRFNRAENGGFTPRRNSKAPQKWEFGAVIFSVAKIFAN